MPYPAHDYCGDDTHPPRLTLEEVAALEVLCEYAFEMSLKPGLTTRDREWTPEEAQAYNRCHVLLLSEQEAHDEAEAG